MRKGLWNKRIPTIFAFVLLFFSIWVTSFFVKEGVIFVGRAGPDKVPLNIKIANISDASFTVSFTTAVKTQAALSIEDTDGNFLVHDDRNKKREEQKDFFSHFITVPDLEPNKIYKFSILSEGETYLNQGKKYEVRTGAKISIKPYDQNPIFGKVMLPGGEAGNDSIVEINIQDGQEISAITKDDGSFIIPTNSLRNINLSNYLKLNKGDKLTINIFRQNMKTTIEARFDEGLLPAITLQKDYDFTNIEEGETSTFSSQLKAPTPAVRFGEVKITSPKNSESFIDNQPLFRGTSLPNQTVKITIESNPIKADVKADGNGVWTFRPAAPLSAGEHTITIQSIDKYGILKTVTQSFIVFASGSQVTESATPSATPILSPSPTQTPGPTLPITPSPTETPVSTPSPTMVITATPTIVPTIGPTVTISPTNLPIATPPPPGSTSTIVMTFISVLLIFSGAALLFLL